MELGHSSVHMLKPYSKSLIGILQESYRKVKSYRNPIRILQEFNKKYFPIGFLQEILKVSYRNLIGILKDFFPIGFLQDFLQESYKNLIRIFSYRISYRNPIGNPLAKISFKEPIGILQEILQVSYRNNSLLRVSYRKPIRFLQKSSRTISFTYESILQKYHSVPIGKPSERKKLQVTYKADFTRVVLCDAYLQTLFVYLFKPVNRTALLHEACKTSYWYSVLLYATGL